MGLAAGLSLFICLISSSIFSRLTVHLRISVIPSVCLWIGLAVGTVTGDCDCTGGLAGGDCVHFCISGLAGGDCADWTGWWRLY